MFECVKPGHIVTRMLAGTIPIKLKVEHVDPHPQGLIYCGWTFDKKTGCEVNPTLGWGPPPKLTGSYLVKVEDQEGNIILECTVFVR